MNIGIILSGCGYLDGAEIHETTLAMLAMDQSGVSYQGIAPERPQNEIVNHCTQRKEGGERSILFESSRIMRGNIIDLDSANVDDYDALIFPGGFGVAKNLSDFAYNQKEYTVNSDILGFAKDASQSSLPMGFICIAPIIMPFIYPRGIRLTIGNDKDIASILINKGAEHIECDASNIIIDENNKTISTPAYMIGSGLTEIKQGIDKLVAQLIKFIQEGR